MEAEMTDAKRHPLEDYLPAEAVQHFQAARDEMRQSLESLLPPGFVAHRRAARREMLLAARSLIDAALRRTEPPTSGPV
jgi:hypothetical protein